MPRHSLPPLQVVSHSFTSEELCAGHVALDFVNTAAGLNREPRDWLESYQGLVQWARLAGVVDEALVQPLITLGSASGPDGPEALERARTLRAALYTLLHHRRDGLQPPTAALAVLQQWRRRAGACVTLQVGTDGLLHASLAACGLDAIGAAIALEACDFLSRPLEGTLGVCAGRNCGWLFLDSSRTGRRRWCSMKTCGNAAKASRHYRRKRGDADRRL